ncbi:MAG TPA: hypothetical protein VF773_15425 [Verrucomicrobiae bacterium]
MSMAAVLTGCGDDDDGDDDDNGGGTNVVRFAPLNAESLTASSKTYTVNVAGQEQMTLRFPSSTTYELTQSGATETGSISEPINPEQNTWTMNLTPAAGQEGSQPGLLSLTWTGNDAGTWTFTPEGGGQVETGTFTVGGGDPDPDPNPNPNPGTNDLSGKSLQFSYNGGGGDRFDFTSATALTWEPAGGNLPGTYQYDSTTGNIRLEVPGRPQGGEVFTAALTPIGAGSGTTSVNIAGGENPGTYASNWSLTQ